MTFLNPALLWGLAAISIPILIHIFNLKKTRKIEFSTLMFLKEIEQSKYKRIKLKQLLILLCRIAFIIMLVLMFARPFDTGYLGSAGKKAKSSVLIILDDSFSMMARDAAGNNFSAAKSRIKETLDILEENDEVFFSTISGLDNSSSSMPVNDINGLKDSIENLKTSDVSRNMNEVFYFAERILRSAANSYREVYLFTDGQKSLLTSEGLIMNELKTDERTKVNFVLIGNRTANNISIDTLNIVTKIFEKSKPVKIKAALNNHNSFNAVNKSIVLTYGELKDEKVIDIPSNSSVDVEFTFNPNTAGYSGGFIELAQNEISDDEISGDNRQYFSIYVPEKISVLLVSSSQSDAGFLKLALQSSEELMKDSAGTKERYFIIREISPEMFAGQDLSEHDAVVFVNKQQFSLSEAVKLKEHVENGGGVIIYPGNLTQTDNYNSVLMKELGLPFMNQSYTSSNGTYKFDKIDFEHPIFEGIFKKESDKKSLNIESPEVKSGIDISTGENSISLITLSGGKNFLVEYSVGRGKLLMFSVSPDMNNSDYPAKTLFSPISVRSILYAANINSIKPAVTGRDYFVDPLSLGLGIDTITVSRPGIQPGKVIQVKDKGSLMNLKDEIGFTSGYLISSGNDKLFEFPVNFNKGESQTTRMEPEELLLYLKELFKLEANIIAPKETVKASILELRTGKDIWQYFLIFGLIFLAIEYMLARSLTKGK